MKHVNRILGPIVEAKPTSVDPIEDNNKLSETITKVDENVNPIEEKPKKGRKKKNV